MMWGPGVARVAADLVQRGRTDLVDATDLGLDRFDEHGRSRLATDPIALPFPVAAAPVERCRDEVAAGSSSGGTSSWPRRAERVADVDPGVRALPHRQHPEARQLAEQLAEVGIMADEARTIGVAGVPDDRLDRRQVERAGQSRVVDDHHLAAQSPRHAAGPSASARTLGEVMNTSG